MRRCFVPATRLSGSELWGFDRPRPLECPVYCQPGFPQCGHGWASSQTLAEGWAAPDHGGACRSNPGGSLVRDNGGSGIPRAAHLQVQHPTGAGYQEAQAWWEIWVVYRRNLDGSEPRYYLSQFKPVRSLSSHGFYSPLKEVSQRGSPLRRNRRWGWSVSAWLGIPAGPRGSRFSGRSVVVVPLPRTSRVAHPAFDSREINCRI